jgi:hypothetical protein
MRQENVWNYDTLPTHHHQAFILPFPPVRVFRIDRLIPVRCCFPCAPRRARCEPQSRFAAASPQANPRFSQGSGDSQCPGLARVAARLSERLPGVPVVLALRPTRSSPALRSRRPRDSTGRRLPLLRRRARPTTRIADKADAGRARSGCPTQREATSRFPASCPFGSVAVPRRFVGDELGDSTGRDDQ